MLLRALAFKIVTLFTVIFLLFSFQANASVFSYSGTLTIEGFNLPPVHAMGSESNVAVSNGEFSISPNIFATTVQFPSNFNHPFTPAMVSFANQTGHFSNGSGIMPVVGNIKFAGTHFLVVPFSKLGAGGPVDPLRCLPVHRTHGGSHSSNCSTFPSPYPSTFPAFAATGARWTTGFASVYVYASIDPTPGIDVNSGYDHRINGEGKVQFVTPYRIRLASQTGIPNDVTAFGILTLDFVPEPGAAVLAVAGAFGLGIVGYKRRKQTN